MSVHAERELKLVAAGPAGAPAVDVARLTAVAAQAGFVLAAPATIVQDDVYLDTSELDLQRAGQALRLRELRSDGSRARVLTIKGRAERDGPVLTRQEAEAAWPWPRPPHGARDLPTVLRHRLEPFLLERPLLERLRLATRRTLIPLRCASGAAELCLDLVAVPQAGGGAQRFWEIELELDGASDATPFVALARALREELHLEQAREDKLQRALALTGAAAPPPARALGADVPARAAGFLVFQDLFERLRQHEPGVRLATDPEEVHRMRVAARRLRAALRVFAPAFPAGELVPLEALARRSGRVLGPLRDLDVMRASIAALRRRAPAELAGGLQRLDDLLGSERDRVHARLLRFLERPARLRAMQRAVELLAAGPGDPGDVTVGRLAPAWILAAVRRVRRKGRRCNPASPPTDWHSLRIAMKRARYALDAFRPLVGEAARDYRQRLARLQDLLGAWHDAQLVCARLHDWHSGPGRTAEPQLLVAAGALVGAHLAAAGAVMRDFERAWRKLDRRKVRARLERAVNDS
jgi:CHAD domain-containing protein